MSELTDLSAAEAVAKLRSREVSPSEMVEAVYARMDEVDESINAIPTRCPERALDRAEVMLLAAAAGVPGSQRVIDPGMQVRQAEIDRFVGR
ncbi:MAG: hypothetical protein R6U92_06905, partial [Bacillota bacterium]